MNVHRTLSWHPPRNDPLTTQNPPDTGAGAPQPAMGPSSTADDHGRTLGTPARGLAVVMFAVLIGGALLVVGYDETARNDGGIELGLASDDDSSETTVAGAAAATPDTVALFVANGSGVGGRALAVTEQLRTGGYTAALEPGDAVTTPTSQVFFLPGQEAAATAVATALGLGADRVVAWPTPPPFAAPPEATVIVQVGADLAA